MTNSSSSLAKQGSGKSHSNTGKKEETIKYWDEFDKPQSLVMVASSNLGLAEIFKSK
jgi:hypothetical protein